MIENMKTYDITVDDGSGQKFKIHDQPEKVVRELGITEQGTVQEALEKLTDLTRRIAKLNQQAPSTDRGTIEIITDRTPKGQLVGYAVSHDDGGDLAGIVVDRERGKIWRQ